MKYRLIWMRSNCDQVDFVSFIDVLYIWVLSRKTYKGIKLERFAVLSKFRRSGVGKHLVKEVLKDVLPMRQNIYLHAQIQTVYFYQKLSFAIDGKIFEEAGIKHYKMIFIA